jgi:hypothetical protein
LRAKTDIILFFYLDGEEDGELEGFPEQKGLLFEIDALGSTGTSHSAKSNLKRWIFSLKN